MGEVEKIGFPSVMYILHKYDALSGPDQDEFIKQDVPYWQISDDTCGPLPDPPADFAMFFVAVFSSPDAAGVQYRKLLRGAAQSAWLPRLSMTALTRWAFFVSETDAPPLMREEEEFGDLVFAPAGQNSAERLHFAFSFLRDFQFRWLLVAQQDTFVHLDAFFGLLSKLPSQRVFISGWRWDDETQAVDPNIGAKHPGRPLPQFFALTRDVHGLLASHRVAHWLRTDFHEDEGRGAGAAGAALQAWLAMLSVQRILMPGVYADGRGSNCPQDAFVLHPVSPDGLELLSDASLQGPPCAVLAPNFASGEGSGGG